MSRAVVASILAFAFTVPAVAGLAVTREKTACAILKRRAEAVIDQGRAGPASGWWCDPMVRFMPYGFWVISLQSGLPCSNGQKFCSSLIGWYAVRKRDGLVINWNMAQNVPGTPL